MRRGHFVALVLILGVIAAVSYWLGPNKARVHNDESQVLPKTANSLEGSQRSDPRPIRNSAAAPVPAIGQRRAYSHNESVFPPQGDAAQVVERLKSLAGAGDARAAFLIFLKLNECARLPDDRRQAELMERMERVGASTDAMSLTYARIRKDCVSSIALLAERGKWLEIAAADGDEQAQLLYASDPEAVLGGPSEMLRDPDKTLKYKATALRYMNNLAARGSVDALMRLAGAYEGGVMIERDPVKAYAYYLAINMARPGLISEYLMNSQRQAVPLDRVSEANDMAKKIYSNCCSG